MARRVSDPNFKAAGIDPPFMHGHVVVGESARRKVQAMGLANDWAFQIISQDGNYGESFDRNLGKGSRLGIERGRNALWKDGGLQYPLPVR